jgi:hypothetical protein
MSFKRPSIQSGRFFRLATPVATEDASDDADATMEKRSWETFEQFLDQGNDLRRGMQADRVPSTLEQCLRGPTDPGRLPFFSVADARSQQASREPQRKFTLLHFEVEQQQPTKNKRYNSSNNCREPANVSFVVGTQET